MASSRKLPAEVQKKIDDGPAGNKEYARAEAEEFASLPDLLE
jgi:hypothetical protein